MENLNLEKFNPKKAELEVVVNKYKQLQINGIDDKAGFLAVDIARKDLKGKRVETRKTGKALREDANAFIKKVLAVENDIVDTIEPEEKRLKEKQDKITLEKAMVLRKESLPIRVGQLAEIDTVIDDEFILSMDDIEFNNYYVGKQKEYLEKKAEAIKEQEEKLRKEKEMQAAIKIAEEKAREEEKQKASLEAQRLENEKVAKERDHELALKKIEEEKAQAEIKRQDEIAYLKKEQEDEIERLKQLALDNQRRATEEQKRKEQERIDLEEQKKQEEDEAREKLEKKKAYNTFLSKHGFVDDGSFKIVTEGNTTTLYKKLGEFKIKENK